MVSNDTPKVKEYKYQHFLGLFLLGPKGHRKKLLKKNNKITTTHQQRTIMNFFNLMSLPRATIQPPMDTLVKAPRDNQKGSTLIKQLECVGYVGHKSTDQGLVTCIIDK
jgi:hypothetical protein